MGANKGSLKEQLEQEERDLEAELTAVKEDKMKVSKKDDKKSASKPEKKD